MVYFPHVVLAIKAIAAEAITAGTLVDFTADGKVSLCDDGDRPHGIAMTNAAANEEVTVMLIGVAKEVEAGGAISVGQQVVGDANARPKALANQDVDEGGTAAYTIYYDFRKATCIKAASAAGDKIDLIFG